VELVTKDPHRKIGKLEKSPVRPIGKSVSPISNYFMEGDE
jgi:hypothetical protein